MDETMLKKYAVKFNRARGVLLAVVAFTAINLLLEVIGADFYMLYSASIPQIIFYIVADDFGAPLFGFLLALIFTSSYLVCWALAKRWRVFVLIALIFFLIDTLILFAVASFAGDLVSFLIDIAVCVWIIVSLSIGTHAWAKLINVTPEDVNAALKETSDAEQAGEERSALESTLAASGSEVGSSAAYGQGSVPYQGLPPNNMQSQQYAPYQAAPQNNMQSQQYMPYQETPPNNMQSQQYAPYQAAPPNQGQWSNQGYPQPSNLPIANSPTGTDDFLKMKVFEFYKQGHSIDSLHFFESIAPHLLENARNSYALSLGADERVILLYDATVKKTGKEGFLLTTKRLYSKTIAEARNDYANISDINSVRIKTSLITKIIVEMNMQKDIEINVSETKRPAEALFNLLDKTIQLLKSQM